VIYVKISGVCYDEYKRKGTSMSKMSGNDFVSNKKTYERNEGAL
jgi:hypothetical protein